MSTAMEWSKLLSAVRTRELQGGLPSKEPAGERRSPFERDYDRVIFSPPIRRLQDKAQVFPLERNDAVRTRLTHSLEVATVAQDLAKTVGRWLLEKSMLTSDADAEAIRTIATTCGLLHDTGNPPFGHAGEKAIQDWFRTLFRTAADDAESEVLATLGGCESAFAEDLLQFDGNAQTLRIVASTQMLADEYGLNLTAATFSALQKYTATSLQSKAQEDRHQGQAAAENGRRRHEWSKIGHFSSEALLVEKVRDVTGTASARHPITFLVEAADDIVYSTVDLEDGVRKGVTDWGELSRALVAEDPSLGELITQTEQYIKNGSMNLSDQTLDIAYVQMLRTNLIAHHVPAVVAEFGNRYDAIMGREYHDELLETGSTASQLAACKKVAREQVYPATEILKLEIRGRKVLQELMDIFWEGVAASPNSSRTFLKTFPGKLYHIMSGNYRRLFEVRFAKANNDAHRMYQRLQLVADYVAGMTDTFAIDLHRELHNG